MKEMKVFIGSSKELEMERKYLAYLTVSLHDAFMRRNLRVTLTKWEYLDPTFTGAKTETRYIERMKDSDLALIIYWKLRGKYTQEEDETARESTARHDFRLARRFVLFKEQFDRENSCSAELDSYKKRMKEEQPDQCGSFLNHAGLCVHFLHQIDMFRHDGEPLLRVENGKIKCDDLELADLSECPETLLNDIGRLPAERFPLRESEAVDGKTIKVFLSAEEGELAEVRNCLTDMAFELNDTWREKKLPQRLEMRLYTPEMKKELLKTSDIALIVYRSMIGDFDADTMQEVYERFGLDEDKKCYVFFQDVQDLSPEFQEFKTGFTEKWGQFASSFQNEDTIRYKFAIQLPSSLKLELDQVSRTIRAGDYMIARLDQLPMYVNSKLIQENNRQRMRLEEELEKCRKQPDSTELQKKKIDLNKNLEKCREELRRYERNLFDMSREIAGLRSQRFAALIRELEKKLDAGDDAGVREQLNSISLEEEYRRLQEKQQKTDEDLRKELELLHKIFSLKIKAALNDSGAAWPQRCESVFREYESQTARYSEMADSRCLYYAEFLAQTLTDHARFCCQYDSLLPDGLRGRDKELFKKAIGKWNALLDAQNAMMNLMDSPKAMAVKVKYVCRAADANNAAAGAGYRKAKEETYRFIELLRPLLKEDLTDEQKRDVETTLADSLGQAARYLIDRKKHKKAETLLLEALDCCGGRKDRRYASILSDLAWLHSKTCPQDAEREYLEMVAICKIFCPIFYVSFSVKEENGASRFTYLYTFSPGVFQTPEEVFAEEKFLSERHAKDKNSGSSGNVQSANLPNRESQIELSDKIELIKAVRELGGFYLNTGRTDEGIRKLRDAIDFSFKLLEQDSEPFYEELAMLYSLLAFAVTWYKPALINGKLAEDGMDAYEIEKYAFMGERMYERLNKIYPHCYSHELYMIYTWHRAVYVRLARLNKDQSTFFYYKYCSHLGKIAAGCLYDHIRYNNCPLLQKIVFGGVYCFLETFELIGAFLLWIQKSRDFYHDIVTDNFEIRQCLIRFADNDFRDPDEAVRCFERAERLAKGLAEKYPESSYFTVSQAAILLWKILRLYQFGRLDTAGEAAKACIAFCRRHDLQSLLAAALHKYGDILCSVWHEESAPDDQDWPPRGCLWSNIRDFTYPIKGCFRPLVGRIEHWRNPEALEPYREALSIYVENGSNCLRDFLEYLIRFYPEVMTEFEKTPQANSEYADYCSLVGEIYAERKNYDKQLEFYRKALDIRLQVLGENHAATADSYDNIAYVWDNKGDYDNALENYRKALDIRLQVLGENHADTAYSYNNIGAAWREKGDYDQALENCRKALKIQQQVLGENHADTAYSYNNIGAAWREKGDYDQALKYYQFALDIFLQVRGKEDIDTAWCFFAIADAWYEKGDYDQALENYRKALKIQQQVLGENHADTAVSYNNIGAAFFKLDNFQSALENHRKALAIRLAVLPEHDPEIARSYNHLGKTYAKLGDAQASEENFRKAYEIAKANPEDDFCVGLMEKLSRFEG